MENIYFQAEDGIRGVEGSRGLGDVYKGQGEVEWKCSRGGRVKKSEVRGRTLVGWWLACSRVGSRVEVE